MPEIVVALDFDHEDRALRIAEELKKSINWFKVGLELFTIAGPGIVRRLKEMGCSVFVDLKFMDIPNTVHGAVKSACELDADMLTVHILGGREMLGEALAARNLSGKKTRIVGVTLLTSLDRGNLAWPDSRPCSEIVTDLAKQGRESGLDGLVCSGRELSGLRGLFPSDFEFVIPGIRLPEDEKDDDQKRVFTPGEAARDGADYIVVGRPITRAEKPVAAAQSFLEAMAAAKSGKKI
jgi:orotidine-5'-phosphate decarboxylase